MTAVACDRTRIVLLAGVLVAISILFQFAVSFATSVNDPLRLDAGKYVGYAYNLEQHGVFSNAATWKHPGGTAAPTPDKLTLPGYPAFLTVLLDGRPDDAFVRRTMLVQAGLGVVSALLAFLIGLRMLPAGWAFAGALLVALSPHMATIGTYVLTETLFTTLVLAGVYALLLAIRPGRRRRDWIVAGLLLGAASLVRPQLQLLPWIALALVAIVPRWRAWFPRVALGALCFLAVVGPWYARNAGVPRTADSPDLLVVSLYHGSFPGLMYRDDPATYGFPHRADPEQDTVTRDLPSTLHRIGADFARDPMRMTTWYAIGKPAMFLSWGMVAAAGDVFIYPPDRSPFLGPSWGAPIRVLSVLVHWPLMVLSLVALVMAARRVDALTHDVAAQRAILLVAALWAYAILIHMIGLPLPRYAIPFRPLAYLLGIVCARAMWMSLRGKSPA